MTIKLGGGFETKMDCTARFVSGVLLFVQNTTAILEANSRVVSLESIGFSGRKIQRLHRVSGAIEYHDLQQIVGTTLAVQGVENALGVQAIRADDHHHRNDWADGEGHDEGLSKTAWRINAGGRALNLLGQGSYVVRQVY
jgi:hypothetical protein